MTTPRTTPRTTPPTTPPAARRAAPRPTPGTLADRLAQARGDAPCDLVLRGGQILSLTTGDLIAGDLAIAGGRIVGFGHPREAARVIDATGLTLVPGFIDAHVHIESSLVTPFEFDRAVAPRGTTTAICDPHEIANVAGAAGIAWFLEAARHTLMDIRVNLPSCVPSSPFETSGARIEAADLAPLMAHEKALGLAEVMNYPGVVHGDPGMLAKLALFAGRHIDGHAPLLTGRDLEAYVGAGIRTEHEATSVAEAREKLDRGLRILIREGSVSKDLAALAPLLTDLTAPYLCLCTDDRNPLDIAEEGHLDHMIRTLIARGCPPLAVYRAASLSAAEAFGLKDRGLIAPGLRADIVAVGSLAACDVRLVLCGGIEATPAAFAGRRALPGIARASVRAPRVGAAAFRHARGGDAQPVIGILEGRILTEHLTLAVAPDATGDRRPDPARDLARIAVIERHGVHGGIATGFVRGFGLARGAIAATVCHDHHNLVVVGTEYGDMALAANRLGAIEGGFVVAAEGRVLAEIALPVAGLMSLAPFEEVARDLRALRDAGRSLGVQLREPFLQLAFLCLPVIPRLKITDRGMVDVDRFALLDP